MSATEFLTLERRMKKKKMDVNFLENGLYAPHIFSIQSLILKKSCLKFSYNKDTVITKILKVSLEMTKTKMFWKQPRFT